MNFIQLFNISFIIYIAMVLFLVYKALRRKFTSEKYDAELGIKTTGYRYMDNQKLYNRTESTPYLALKTLVDKYNVSEGDELVDFGAGKGRISIYLNKSMGIPVTGVEINKITFDEANNNLKNYHKQSERSPSEVSFVLDYAEEYQIKEQENIFFFFNPFHIEIFKKVTANIISNAEKHNKSVDIILYYPMNGFQQYLNENTAFELVKNFNTKGMISRREKIMIYRYEP